MTDPQIRITVAGKLALTTAQAAAEFGVEPVTVRTGIRDLSIEPVAHLDSRTPLYAAVPLRRAWKARPGRGANLRGPQVAPTAARPAAAGSPARQRCTVRALAVNSSST